MGLFSKENKKPDRFVEKCSQGYGLGAINVMVDTETGVNYFIGYGMNGEMTIVPLLGSDGKVLVDKIGENLGEKVY